MLFADAITHPNRNLERYPIMFRTLTAKYPGICRRCNGPIAIGDKIRYGGPGRSYHLASACATSTHADIPTANRSTYTRFSSGAEVYTNRAGRCEDAPCCGCCS